MTLPVFSFGTLRSPEVQKQLFGRRVLGSPDTIHGYRIGRVRITDAASIAASGTDIHPALIITSDPEDTVSGEILDFSADELASVERYERVSFIPIEVRTRSGRVALAYIPRPELESEG